MCKMTHVSGNMCDTITYLLTLMGWLIWLSQRVHSDWAGNHVACVCALCTGNAVSEMTGTQTCCLEI